MRILLVEDDLMLGEAMQYALRQHKLAADWLKLGTEAINACNNEIFDLLILDLGLPDIDGLDVLKTIRKSGNSVPILILTAKDAVENKICGLDSGADDYLIKPIDLNELLARIRALTRRSAGRSESVLSYKNVVLNSTTREVSVNNSPIILSAKEFSILEVLMQNVGRVITKNNLEQSLYSWGDEPCSNTLEVHIHHLRKKLGNDFISTLRGVGYVIK